MENALSHLMGTLVILVLFVGGAALLFRSLLWMFERIETMQADREAERLFVARWDRAAFTELHTWIALRQELEADYERCGPVEVPAPKVLLDAVDRRIEEARRRHIRSRIIRLRRGRKIITTNQN